MSIYALGDQEPRLGRDVWVAPNAAVIGDIELGDAVSVWFAASLRGDNEKISVGDGSNIQEACVLHTDAGFPLRIGKNCTIGHSAILHGCTIEDGSLVGMGATILNGATIGKGCLIGAGALITEGKHIPDGSLVVGAPGKVVKELDAATIANLLKSAEGYRAKSKAFASDLREIKE